VLFCFSNDNKLVYLGARLSTIDPATAPADRLLRVLQENDDIGPAYFCYSKSLKCFYLYRPMENRDISPPVLRAAIDKFDSVLRRTEPLWNPKKWVSAEKATSSGTPEPTKKP
jgi:hypothetical protein